MFILADRGPEIEPEVIATLKAVSPSTLGHLTDAGFARGLGSLLRPVRLVGHAVTVRIPHLDSTAVHCALDQVKPGDVVVVDQSGDEERACWGGLVTHAAIRRGVAGAVVAGPITDVQELIDHRFAIFHRGVAAHTTRIAGIEGAINLPIAVSGAIVHPGDIVFGDENGVAFLSHEDARRIASLLAEKEANEIAIKARLDRGESLATISGARELFDAARAALV